MPPPVALTAASSSRSAVAKRSMSASRVTSVAHTSSPSRSVGVVGEPARQRQAGQHPAPQQRGMDARRVGDVHGELVEVRAAVDARHAHVRQGLLQLACRGRSPGGHVAQPVRPEAGQVDGGGKGAQRLVGADVAGSLVAADVLLAGTQRHDVGAAALQVQRAADEATGDLPHQRVAGGEDAEVGPAVLRRDAQRLALAGADVGAVLAGAGQHGQRHRFDDGHEERPGSVGQPGCLGHRLQHPEGVGLAQQHTCDRACRIGQRRLQRRQVGAAIGERRQLLEAAATIGDVGTHRLDVVAVDRAADQDALAAGGTDGHQGGLRGRRGAVVMRGRDHRQPGQLGQQRLVLEDGLQGALADLGLVGRVGRVGLAAREDGVHGSRQVVAVHAGAEEAGQVDPVARGQRGQPRR